MTDTHWRCRHRNLQKMRSDLKMRPHHLVRTLLSGCLTGYLGLSISPAQWSLQLIHVVPWRWLTGSKYYFDTGIDEPVEQRFWSSDPKVCFFLSPIVCSLHSNNSFYLKALGKNTEKLCQKNHSSRTATCLSHFLRKQVQVSNLLLNQTCS